MHPNLLLQKQVQDINATLANLDYESLWHGFHRYPFALYNSDWVYLPDQTFPWDDRFRGNTSIEFDGGYLAIWNIAHEELDLDPIKLYPLVHEMFHCFQREHQEPRFPNDLELLLSPEDPHFYALRKHETELLKRAFSDDESKREASFQQFAATRQRQFEAYPDFVKQICYAETLEGTAEYVGLKALKQLSPEAYQNQIQNYLQKLSQPELLFDIRRLTYFTGALTLIMADRLGMAWDHSIRNQSLSNYELLFKDIQASSEMLEIPDDITKNMQKRQADLRAKIEKAETDAQTTTPNAETIICGYDPMNMHRLGDKIYCSHFVFLKSGDDFLKLDGEIVLHMVPGSPDQVLSYTQK